MKEVLVVFGSKSDENVYKQIADMLTSYEVRICSAHRTPGILDEILKGSFKVIIAGAGLAAHLPGVIASKTTKPVIGVPCSGNFGGLDAFLSIVQMPPGVPVLAVGVDEAETAAENAMLMLKHYDGVNITGEIKNKRVEAAVKIVEKFKISCSFSAKPDKNKVNINFFNFEQTPKNQQGALIINVPLKEGSTARDSITLMEKSDCLLVGLNMAENAAIAAAEIMGKQKELKDYRDEMKKKVIEDDEEIKNAYNK